MTIDGIGLRRIDLREDRLKKIAEINTCQGILDLAAECPDSAKHQAMAQKAREFIDAATGSDAEFSSMVIHYVARRGL
jgi:hypothetical protein